MSDEVERVFSGARRTITWSMAWLKPAAIEVVDCASSWLTRGILKGLKPAQEVRDSSSVAPSEVVDTIEGQDENEDEGNGSECDIELSDGSL
jgi:hypothetical protein